RRIGFAAPGQEEPFGQGPARVDRRLGDRRQVVATGRLGGERERRRRDSVKLVASVAEGQIDQRRKVPPRGQACDRGLQVGARIACAQRQPYRLRGCQRKLGPIVYEQAPDPLERHYADQLLDVDASISQRATVPVRLGDLGREGAHTLQSILNLCHVS